MSQREKQIAILHDVARHASGTSFILLMEHSVQGHGNYDANHKDYSIHCRFNQPCQGGETRKYESHNPGDCTQPHNSKPSDLYHPFPNGKPSAIAFPLGGHKSTNEPFDGFLRAFFTKDSPFLKGSGHLNVEFLVNDKGLAYGYIIGRNNLDVDPTIMISLTNTIRNVRNSLDGYKTLMGNGLTHWEAVAVLFLNRGSVNSLCETADYYFPTVFSAKRYFGQQPNDLSGGVYSDRTDYNRTYVSDIFLGEESEGCEEWIEGMAKQLGVTLSEDYSGRYVNDISTVELAKAAKEWFAKKLAEEKIVVKPYEYRDDSGNVRPTPIIKSQAIAKEAA